MAAMPSTVSCAMPSQMSQEVLWSVKVVEPSCAISLMKHCGQAVVRGGVDRAPAVAGDVAVGFVVVERALVEAGDAVLLGAGQAGEEIGERALSA